MAKAKPKVALSQAEMLGQLLRKATLCATILEDWHPAVVDPATREVLTPGDEGWLTANKISQGGWLVIAERLLAYGVVVDPTKFK